MSSFEGNAAARMAPELAEDGFPLLSAIVDSSEDAIISKDLNGVITSWNKSAERVFGYWADEAIGRTVAELLIPSDRQQEEPTILARLRRGERVEHFETVRRRKDGSLLDVSLMISPVKDRNGRIVGASKIARDISDQKRAERAIQTLNARLTADLSAMTRVQQLSTRPLPLDGYGEVLQEIVAAAVEITGADMGNIQLIENGELKIIAHRGFQAPFLDFFNRALAGEAACGTVLQKRERVIVEDIDNSPIFANTPALAIMQHAGVRAVQATPLITRSGEILGVFSTHFRSVRRPSDEELRLVDLLARQTADLLESRRNSEILRRSEERFRGIVAQSVAGIAESRPDGLFVTVNDRYCEITGYSRPELLQMRKQDITHPEDQPRNRELFRRCVEEHEPFEVEKRYLRKDGSAVWVHNSVAPVCDSSGLLQSIATVSIDITQRKRAEQLNEEQKRSLQMIAEGQPLEQCLTALTEAAARLEPGLRACVLIADTERQVMADTFTAHFPPSFGSNLRGAPIGESQEWKGLCDEYQIRDCYLARIAGSEELIMGSFVLCFQNVHDASEWERAIADFGARAAAIAIERKHAEDRERAATAKFESVFNQSGIFAGIVDLDGYVREANNLSVASCGYTREQVLNRPFWQTPWWSGSEHVQARIRFASEQAAAGIPFQEILPYWVADGTERVVDFAMHPIRDHSGVICFLHPTGIDITDRQHAEAQLLASEEKFRTLADNMSQFAWMTDETGWISWYNRRWYDYTGTTFEDMQGTGWEKLYHPGHLDRVVRHFRKCLETGEPWEDTFQIRSKTGEYRWFLSRAVPIRDEGGKIRRWFGTNTDITERLETERQLRSANRDLEQFAYSASHDLQEPLRTVKIYSELLGNRYQDRLDGNALTFMQYIRKGATRMETLVQDLLAYTQTINFERPAEKSDSKEALDAALSDLSHAIHETGAAITSGPLPLLSVHNGHLRQLFQNLIGNAIKYRSPERRPLIQVGAEQHNGNWIFAVSDNGIGIDPAYKTTIFGLFKRLHTNDEYSGTGIGLAICQRIVDRYHGRIWVDSEPGRGSTFRFELPV
jgi:PAS domain S-box-containing protein